MNNKLETIAGNFSGVIGLCTASFLQLSNLKRTIHFPLPITKERIQALSALFEEGVKVSKLNMMDDPAYIEYQEKVNDFFTANEFARGKMLSKGTVDFFEYAMSNPDEFGMLQTYLSRVEKQMETAWYGILQKYGKLTLSLSKQAYPA